MSTRHSETNAMELAVQNGLCADISSHTIHFHRLKSVNVVEI